MRCTARAGAGAQVVEIADGLGLDALLAGSVEEGPREVVLEPVGVRFGGDQLELSDRLSRNAQARGSVFRVRETAASSDARATAAAWIRSCECQRSQLERNERDG